MGASLKVSQGGTKVPPCEDHLSGGPPFEVRQASLSKGVGVFSPSEDKPRAVCVVRSQQKL